MEAVVISHYIQKIDFFGEEAIKAGNEKLEMIIVPGWGSNVISMVVKESGVSLLKTPASAEAFHSAPVVYGIPILFPPNRIRDGRFTYQDRSYQFNINDLEGHNHEHGFLYDKKWELIHMEATENKALIKTRFMAADYHDVVSQFPHPFEINMQFILKGSSFLKRATIKNHGIEAFPWGFGYHTTFNFPFGGPPSHDTQISIPVNKRWILNERLLPTGELQETELVNQLSDGMNITGLPLDDVFLRSGSPNEAILVDPKANVKVVYRCDENFTQWVVYNGNGKEGFVCPEPYTWVTNAPNLNLPDSITGLQELQPGQQVKLESEICIFEI